MDSTNLKVRKGQDEVMFFLTESHLLKNPRKRAKVLSKADMSREHLYKRIQHGTPVKGFTGRYASKSQLGLSAARATGEPVLVRKGKLKVPCDIT